jgi:hypothetical protein
MSQTNRAGDRNRRRVLRVEGLETRELLSVVPLFIGNGQPSHRSALVASGSSLQALAGDAAGGSDGINSTQTDQPTPTPHELARQRFVAKLDGTYVIGPGRFSNQAAQVQILAEGGSNQSLHVTLHMGIFTPTDTVNGTTTAIAVIFPRNVAETGSILALDATAPPPSNRVGIPTHYTWTVDSSSGGIYLAAGGFGTGQGTIDIHFIPGGKIPKGATGAGRAILVFKGMINTGGVFSDIRTPGNRSKHP